MAAVTLTTIRSLVRGYLDESSAADWTNAELNILINQRYHRVYSAVVTVFEDYNITTNLVNTVANTQEYDTSSADPIPSDIFKIRRVEINYDVSNANSVMQRATPITNIDAIRVRLGESNLGTNIFRNPAYYYLGGKLGFLPIPDKTGTDAIKLWYVKTASDLSADASTIDIPYPERYWNIIAEGATGDALRFGQQDSPEADKFEQKFIAGVILMQEELEDRVAEETKSVTDVSGENLDFGAPGY